uniref:Uncharacterized protein n=1 Tax=Arundo donax TaxID=35708 RepID=A0A0A9HI82_ARUDO
MKPFMSGLGCMGKMSIAGGNNNGGSPNEYEKLKLANIERNKRKLEALNIPRINTTMQQGRPKKISKKVHNTSHATTEPHNVRPRPQRNIAQHEEEQQMVEIQSIGDFLGDIEGSAAGRC